MARPSPGHLQLLIPARPGPPHSPLIPEGLGKSWGAVPLWRTCGPTVRAGDAEAGTWARTPGGLCGVGVRGEVQRPQLCTVGRGTGGGWTPGICFPHGIPDLPPAAPWALGPGEDVPRSCRASGCGGPGPGWADGLAPTAPAPRSPCTWVDPRDQGPKEQARADVLRFQGAISGAGGRAAVHGAAHPPPAAPPNLPR